MTEDIQVSILDGVCEIRFNRPSKKNAITTAMYAGLRDAVQGAEREDKVRVILFTAQGDTFTAGNDLADFLASRSEGLNAPVYGFLKAIATSRKPLVAAVKGAAIGIGTTMLLHCDIVLAAPKTKFIAPFVNLGIVPEGGSTLLLPRLIGHQRAAELVMLGEPLEAEQASSFGLINTIVAFDGLEAEARRIASVLAAKAPNALRRTKALLRGDSAETVNRIMEEGEHLESQLASPESNEAIRAMLEKRPANFAKTDS